MNKNLFLKEWKRNWLTLLIWTVIISAMVFVPMTFFQTIAGNQKQFGQALEARGFIPTRLHGGIRAFKGISIKAAEPVGQIG